MYLNEYHWGKKLPDWMNQRKCLFWMSMNKEKGFKNEVEEICFWMKILEEKGSTFIKFRNFLFLMSWGKDWRNMYLNEYHWGKKLPDWINLRKNVIEWEWLRKKGSELNAVGEIWILIELEYSGGGRIQIEWSWGKYIEEEKI